MWSRSSRRRCTRANRRRTGAGPLSENKTRETDASVEDFLAGVENDRRREDARAVAALMEEITGELARMWGPSIIGFGRYRYRYDSGREGEFFLTGVSPRKSALTVYIMPGFASHDALMDRLGKHRTGRSCLYINKLEDVDLAVLEELVATSVAWMREKYGA